MKPRVAVVTCRGEDVDPDSPILLEALGRAGVEAELAIWDDPAVDWEGYDLSVLRSTWDYVPRLRQFLDWAQATPRLLNPLEVVRYSTDKHYLADLGAKGVPVVPTRFVDVGQEPDFPEGEFVVKPAVGAGSLDAGCYLPHQVEEARQHVRALHARGRDVMVQPYLPAVDQEGETALVYLEGRFSHAMTKAAMLRVEELDRTALFRREQMSVAEPPPDLVDFGSRVLAAAGWPDLLYARVDVARGPAGWAVMELELVEPSLFLWLAPQAADTLARALATRARRLSSRAEGG